MSENCFAKIISFDDNNNKNITIKVLRVSIGGSTISHFPCRKLRDFLMKKRRNFEIEFNYGNDLLYLCQCMHFKIKMITTF